VARYHDQPEAASTGYLPLYLRRMVYILGENELDAAWRRQALLVASGSSLERLRAAAKRAGFELEILEMWESPHTNPKPPAILAALRARSLRPLQVRHYLVELKRQRETKQ